MVDFDWLFPIGMVVVIGFFLVRGISATIDLKHKIVGEMEPRHSPPLHERFATKAELMQTNKRLDAISAEIRESFAEMQKAGRISRGNLYEKIEATSQEVAAVKTQSQLTYQHMQRMETKLDRWMEKK